MHFLKWFEDLKFNGPGQDDSLFAWLATACSLAEMRWFLAQEVAGEAGFDDLIAMRLVGMPVRPKLALAANFWDEMGAAARAACMVPCSVRWQRIWIYTSRRMPRYGRR